MAHVDFKITDWERIEIPVGKEVEVKALLEKGEITSANDLYELVEGCYKGHIDGLASEQLPLEENDYQPTIEMFDDVDDSNETVFSNGTEPPREMTEEEMEKIDEVKISELSDEELVDLRQLFFDNEQVSANKIKMFSMFEEIIIELERRSNQ